MNQQKLKSAIEEARRFILKAQAAINEQGKTKYGNCPRELANLRKPL